MFVCVQNTENIKKRIQFAYCTLRSNIINIIAARTSDKMYT